MLEQLIPRRRDFDGADLIFTMNAAAQAAAANGRPVINTAMGALLDDDGKFVALDSVMKQYAMLTPAEIAPYAPIAGDPRFLLALTQRHWPELTSYGAGVATPGGTGALAFSLRNLLEPGMRVLTASPYWGPYDVLATESGMRLATAPYPPINGSLDVASWRARAMDILSTQGRLLVWLNDPCHNPTGRSLSTSDRRTLLELLREVSDHGPVSLVLDFAYLDYARDPSRVREALNDYRAVGEAGRVLVGACLSLSKAFTLYGARAGALVFPWATDPSLFAALSTSCRGTYSNCARAPMHVLLRLMSDESQREALEAEHAHWRQVLRNRADALDSALKSEGFDGVPWDGGFFVTVPVVHARTMSERLADADVFTVPVPEGLRIGICGLRASDAMRVASTIRTVVTDTVHQGA